jgi:DsbC/DsbD-like thiol-disulfide interchange protein
VVSIDAKAQPKDSIPHQILLRDLTRANKINLDQQQSNRQSKGKYMDFRKVQLWLVLALCLCGASDAESPVQPVQWTALVIPESPIKQGSRISLQLSAEIQEGWHVYGLIQMPGGPTPLHVALNEDGAVQIAGATSGTAPIKKHDPSFDLETQFYTQSFVLHIPAQVKQHPPVGRQSVPVSVRFQACSDRVCLPPKTVLLSVQIEVLPGT